MMCLFLNDFLHLQDHSHVIIRICMKRFFPACRPLAVGFECTASAARGRQSRRSNKSWGYPKNLDDDYYKKDQGICGRSIFFGVIFADFQSNVSFETAFRGIWVRCHILSFWECLQHTIRLRDMIHMFHIMLFDNVWAFNHFSVAITNHYKSSNFVQWTKVNPHIRCALHKLVAFGDTFCPKKQLKGIILSSKRFALLVETIWNCLYAKARFLCFVFYIWIRFVCFIHKHTSLTPDLYKSDFGRIATT